MLVVLKVRRDPFEEAAALDEDLLVRVDEDVTDGRIAEQRLERPEAEHIVEQLGKERFALRQADWRAFFGENLAKEHPDLALGARSIRLGQRFEIQAGQQLLVHAGPEIQVLLTRRLNPGVRGR